MLMALQPPAVPFTSASSALGTCNSSNHSTPREQPSQYCECPSRLWQQVGRVDVSECLSGTGRPPMSRTCRLRLWLAASRSVRPHLACMRVGPVQPALQQQQRLVSSSTAKGVVQAQPPAPCRPACATATTPAATQGTRHVQQAHRHAACGGTRGSSDRSTWCIQQLQLRAPLGMYSRLTGVPQKPSMQDCATQPGVESPDALRRCSHRFQNRCHSPSAAPAVSRLQGQ